MVRRPALMRAALFFSLAFGAFQRCVGQALTCPEPTDPCVTHKSIKEPFRSSAHNYSHTQPAICDNRLIEGWYRFTSGVGGKIPTTKPEPNTCGTVAPIWMNSPHPQQVGQTVDATACINLNNIRWGCFRTIDICAKKCEDMATMANYFVYYLRPPFGCDMAYCAGNGIPCSDGSESCTRDFPNLMVPLPSIEYGNKYENNRPMMKCNFLFPSWGNVSFHVEWHDNGSLVSNNKFCPNEGEVCDYKDSEGILYSPPKVGTMMHCRLRMRYNSHPQNKWSIWRQSESFFVGIKVKPEHIKTQQCDPLHQVTLQPTIPIDKDLLLQVLLPKEEKNGVSVAVTQCQLYIKEKKDYTIDIQPTCDDMITNDPGISVDVHFLIVQTEPFWAGHILPSVRVRVLESPGRTCSSYNDPHYSTFDGSAYNFLRHGDYVLFQDLQNEVEVHTRLWTCNQQFPGGASCNCGVAIRQGRDVIRLSMCNRQLYYYKPTIMHASLPRGRPSIGTKIKKHGAGSYMSYEIILESGTVIQVHRRLFGLNIYLSTVKTGNRIIRGMCGNFDGVAANDLDDGGDNKSYRGDQEGFGLSWRVPYPNSYFDSLPPDKATKIEPRSYCYCEQSLCQDINTHFQQAKEMNEAFNSQPNAIASMLNGDEVIDQEEGEYFNDEEEAEQAHRRIRRRRDIGDFERHFNMSTENATQFCKSVIENSLGVKVCSEVPNIDLARAERDCVFDLKASGNKEFASSIVTSVMTLCADKAYKNMSLYEKDDDGVLRPPKVITENLCPNECSNHGNCSNSTCICDKGYTAADCSMSINTIPELMGIYDGGLCDKRKRPCKKTNIFGDGFLDSENLTCHVTEFKVFGDAWSPRSTPQELPGGMFDLFGVKCDLPDPPTKIGDYDNPGTPAGGLYIRISNNRIDASLEKMSFISYDSLCLNCSRKGVCVLRNDSCMINGHCFAPEQPSPRDWCKQCMPETDQFDWIRRKVNYPPKFTSPSVWFALVGENLSLQLKATDPENRTINYRITSTDAQGYTFTPNGQLNYTMTSADNKTFTFVATDECNANDTTAITLMAQFCPCQNGGTCYSHPYYPRGSGQYECACPKGFNGSRCEINIDECQSNLCVNGSCVDGVAGYTCKCDAGFEGRLCDVKISNCSEDSCYPGVNCTEDPSGFVCGPCPVGLSGNGKSCIVLATKPPTTSESATSTVLVTKLATATERVTLAVSSTEQPTTTERVTSKASSSFTELPTTTERVTSEVSSTELPTTTERITSKVSSTRLPTTTVGVISKVSSNELPTTTERVTLKAPSSFTVLPTTTERVTSKVSTTELPTTTERITSKVSSTRLPTTTVGVISKVSSNELPTTTERVTSKASSASTDLPTSPERVTSEDPTTSTNTRSTAKVPITAEYTAQCRLKIPWRNELSDKRTKEYNDLQTSLEKEFQATYKNDADFQRVNIESFSKGSVIAKFKLFFKTEKKDPLGPLADELKDGKLGDIDADPNSLKILRPQEKEQEESSQTEIVVIAVVVVIVAVLVAVACCILFRRKYYYYDLEKKSRKPPEKDPERFTYENPEYCDIPELENNREGVTKPAPHYEIISPSLPKNHVVPGEGLEAKNHTSEELKAAKPIHQNLTPGVSQEEQQNKPSFQAKARHSVNHNTGFQN